MKILTAYDTDIGTSKNVNQDALCIKEAQTNYGSFTMAVICDGMGGYSSGEVASSTVLKAFSGWFENKLPMLLNSDFTLDKVRADWNEIVKLYSRLTVEYGLSLKPSIKLGTTLTAILINKKYGAEIMQVGDSRLYRIYNTLEQITRDHTKIAHLIEKGQLALSDGRTNLTLEEKEYWIEHHPERHILSQCIGGSRVECTPDSYRFGADALFNDTVFLICSDGFRHELSKQEITDLFSSHRLSDEQQMKAKIREAIELNKQRGEKDNITAVLLKITRQEF